MAMPVTRYMVKRRRPGNSGLKIAAATDYTGITAQDSFASVLADKAPLVQEKLVEVRLCQDSKFEEHGCIKVTGDERLGRVGEPAMAVQINKFWLFIVEEPERAELPRDERPVHSFFLGAQARQAARTYSLPELRVAASGSLLQSNHLVYNYVIERWKEQGLGFDEVDGVHTDAAKRCAGGEKRAGRGAVLANKLSLLLDHVSLESIQARLKHRCIKLPNFVDYNVIQKFRKDAKRVTNQPRGDGRGNDDAAKGRACANALDAMVEAVRRAISRGNFRKHGDWPAQLEGAPLPPPSVIRCARHDFPAATVSHHRAVRRGRGVLHAPAQGRRQGHGAPQPRHARTEPHDRWDPHESPKEPQ